MAGECQCPCKSAPGHPEVALKTSAVAFRSKECISSVTASTALLQWGKSTAGGGQRATGGFYWS